MKRSNAVVPLTFWLAAMFTLPFSSQTASGEKPIMIAELKQTDAHIIHVVDRNGRTVVSGIPSGTGQVFDVAVGRMVSRLRLLQQISPSVIPSGGPGLVTATASLAAIPVQPTGNFARQTI